MERLDAKRFADYLAQRRAGRTKEDLERTVTESAQARVGHDVDRVAQVAMRGLALSCEEREHLIARVDGASDITTAARARIDAGKRECAEARAAGEKLKCKVRGLEKTMKVSEANERSLEKELQEAQAKYGVDQNEGQKIALNLLLFLTKV